MFYISQKGWPTKILVFLSRWKRLKVRGNAGNPNPGILMYLLLLSLSQPPPNHHYIKGHISVFGRGFICFCCLEPNFLHGVSCPYCPEYWRVSSVVPQKNWGVWTHFLIFDPFYWLENQPACDKSCIETAFECSFSFWNPFNLSAYGLFLHDMSEEHIVPKLA